jgi:NAD(P)-dependent dehydrogenase (short-subunit alcohol dehydrogenase family)
VAEISEDRAASALGQLEGKGDVTFVQTDVSDPDSAQGCVDRTVEAFGTVHILVNNAALYYDIDNFDPSYEYLQKVFSVNQHGSWLMARAAAPVMVEQRYGRIVNQSSSAAYMYQMPEMPFSGLGNFSYSITKWGVVGLTKFMAAQLGQYGVTVNCICPGVTMTEATKKVVPDFYIQGLTAQTAMKQTLEPEDLAGACVFFASDDAKFVTGQVLVVDGGLSMPA